MDFYQLPLLIFTTFPATGKKSRAPEVMEYQMAINVSDYWW
jgi:hypothetical protein